MKHALRAASISALLIAGFAGPVLAQSSETSETVATQGAGVDAKPCAAGEACESQMKDQMGTEGAASATQTDPAASGASNDESQSAASETNSSGSTMATEGTASAKQTDPNAVKANGNMDTPTGDQTMGGGQTGGGQSN